MRQPRILMCPPDYYGIEYEINPWMSRSRGSTLDREADLVLHMRCGPERGVAATKTYTSQILNMTLLAMHLGRQRGGDRRRPLRGDGPGAGGRAGRLWGPRPEQLLHQRRLLGRRVGVGGRDRHPQTRNEDCGQSPDPESVHDTPPSGRRPLRAGPARA